MTPASGFVPTWQSEIGEMPLVAILRGLQPDKAIDTVGGLIEAGFRAIEIPLNSPDPLRSIARLVETFGDRALLGAGTVLMAEEAEAVAATGARLIVAPNTDARVAEVAARENAVYCPGAMTPTEVFEAFRLGANFVKLFPGELIGPHGVKAMRAVVPEHAGLFPVGGVSLDSMEAYVTAGANGFGLGSALFKTSMTPEEVAANARGFIGRWREISERNELEPSRHQA